MNYSKTCVKRPLPKRPEIGFQDQLSLNAGQKYCRMAECSMGSILQYFRPLLSYHLSLRSLFCLFLSDCFSLILKNATKHVKDYRSLYFIYLVRFLLFV